MDNVPGFKTHANCPLNTNCQSKKIFESLVDGKLYSYHGSKKRFFEHKCKVRGADKPEKAYLATWRNDRTHRIRHVGPERLIRSVLKHPKDIQSSEKDWVLVALFETVLEWKEIEIPKD